MVFWGEAKWKCLLNSRNYSSDFFNAFFFFFLSMKVIEDEIPVKLRAEAKERRQEMIGVSRIPFVLEYFSECVMV